MPVNGRRNLIRRLKVNIPVLKTNFHHMILLQRRLPSTSSTLRKYAVSCLSICLAHTMEPETGGKSLTMLILHDLLCGYWTWQQQHEYFSFAVDQQKITKQFWLLLQLLFLFCLSSVLFRVPVLFLCWLYKWHLCS